VLDPEVGKELAKRAAIAAAVEFPIAVKPSRRA